MNILNFGCGLNTYSETLYELGHKVTSLDITDNGISEFVDVTTYDGINIPGEYYDLVLISTVLHHIPYKNHLEILQRLKKKTKNIIILEDYIGNDTLSVLLTCGICAITNVSFFNREYAFRTHSEWLELFKMLEYTEIEYIHGTYEYYRLSF